MMKNRYQNVDALRFIFAIIIVYFHVLHSNIIPFVGASEKIYTNLAVNCANAGWIVECFFIVGGAFLYKTYVSNPKLTVTEFFCRKVIRLWPVLFFSIILAVLTGRNNIYVGLFNALFLQCTGLSFAYKGIVWYVSPFFWVSVFLFTILRKCKHEVAQVVLPLMVYFSYVVNINYSEGAFGRETIFFFLNLGMLRAIAGLGLGCILEELILKVNGIKNQLLSNGRIKEIQKYIWRGFSTLMEAVCLFFLMIYFLNGKVIKNNNQFIVVIVFSILFIFMMIGNGYVSKILSFAGNGGKYAYSIYVMQQFAFDVLSHTLWRQVNLVEKHIYATIFLSVLWASMVGITTYYLIEKPIGKVGKKIVNKIDFNAIKVSEV